MGANDGQQSYLLNYDYDVYGNRLQKDSRNDNLDSNGQPVITQHFVEAGDYSPTTNRFTSGMTYDAAGNVTTDSRFRLRQFLYDANNRQRQSANLDGSNAVVSVYDGAGQRVATKANGVLTTVIVYDAGGKLVAEYAQSVSAAGTQYVMGDHQGSTRVVMNTGGAGGGIVSRHDYLPFGEDVPSNVGMRSTTQGYAQADGVRQKYAGMEQDEATGMSHTLWREFDNRSARWTAPDPYSGSMELASPQSFNRYTYVNNDPVNKVDPTGLRLSDIGVVQTNDAGYAHTLQGASDAAWMKEINRQYAERHNLTIEETQENGGTRYSIAQQQQQGRSVTDRSLDNFVNGMVNTAVETKSKSFAVAEDVKAMLAIPECSTYVTNLIEAVAAQTKNPYVSNNGVELVDSIRSQRGFVFKDLKTIGGTMRGNILSGNALVLISPNNDPGRILRILYGDMALHEAIHLAGRNGVYIDEALARAVFSLMSPERRSQNPLPREGDYTAGRWQHWEYTLGVSAYWNKELLRNCAPPKR